MMCRVDGPAADGSRALLIFSFHRSCLFPISLRSFPFHSRSFLGLFFWTGRSSDKCKAVSRLSEPLLLDVPCRWRRYEGKRSNSELRQRLGQSRGVLWARTWARAGGESRAYGAVDGCGGLTWGLNQLRGTGKTQGRGALVRAARWQMSRLRRQVRGDELRIEVRGVEDGRLAQGDLVPRISDVGAWGL